MSEVKRWGDPDYGHYGFGWCNPAFYGQEPVPNEVYLSTVPEDDPWREPLVEGFAKLDAKFPGWKISQIKQKFFGCRFYADAPPEVRDSGDRERWDKFMNMCRDIEIACDAKTPQLNR